MMDSGATRNFLLERFVCDNQIRITRKARPYRVRNADGSPNAGNRGWVLHNARMWMKYQTYKGLVTWDIATIGHIAILGMPWLKQAKPMINWEEGMVQMDTKPAGQRHKVSGLAESTIPAEYAEFEAMFMEPAIEDALPKHQPWDHKIPLMPKKNPEKQPIYAITPANLEVLCKYIDENKAKGWIQESQSPVGYPILFIPKPDNSKRLCIDYQKLNAITVKNSYALPLILELQDRLQRAKWFTKFDIPAAYHQIRIKAREEWKTAFRTCLRHYKYQVMPFGLTNAPATFQSYINNVLQKYLDIFVTVYIDNILIYSEIEEEHRVHVRKVLTALNKRGIWLK